MMGGEAMFENSKRPRKRGEKSATGKMCKGEKEKS